MAPAAALRAPVPVVRVRGLVKRYGRREAVRGVDLEVARGEMYGLIGPDGAGKSSLLHAVAGVLAFDAGEVDVFGVRLDSERAAERVKGRIGLMPQGLGLNLYPNLSVEENVDFFGRLRLVPEGTLASRKARLLSLTRLDAVRQRPMRQLSGGMKQKLALVCTLVHEPELVILDEPTTGVNPLSRRGFWALLADLLRGGRTTALVSTAYMDEAVPLPSGLADVRRPRRGRGRAGGDRSGGRRAEPRGGLHRHPAPSATGRPRTGPRARAGGVGAGARADRRRRDRGGAPLTRLRAVPRRGRRELSGATGEIFGLVGANGAGKSSIIRMLTGILTPTAGTGRIGGVDVRAARRAAKQRIGYMSQAFSLYRDLTVVENIRLYAGIYGLDRRETRRRLDWILEMAGLVGREDARAEALPVGLRQRLALGCALVHRPEILFLDEPTSGVDPLGRRRFWDVLRHLTRVEGAALLFTTHDMSEAGRCDRLGLMHAGRLIANAAPDELRRAVAADAGLPGPPSMEDAFVYRIAALEARGQAAGGDAA